MKQINNVKFPTVELPENVWQYIRGQLGKQPYDEVAPIIQSMGQQIDGQVNPPPPQAPRALTEADIGWNDYKPKVNGTALPKPIPKEVATELGYRR
jgi:hypothetical protein